MRIAFLNLCHCDPQMVARVANKLTAYPEFDMYIHVDAKTKIEPFQNLLNENRQVYFIKDRERVYWGGYNAIYATYKLIREALNSEREYEYFVLLQNLDYPLKSNKEIDIFFQQNHGKEYIRGCKIAESKDWQFSKKYKIYNQRDNDFYLATHNVGRKYIRYLKLAIYSITTIGFDGIIKEQDGKYPLYYGTAQWAITRDCAEYIDKFEKTHQKFNRKMKHIQFPDEEYFHTIVHNSNFKTRCIKFDEPVKRWLVNWRNLHYFEFPKEVSVLTEKDYPKISQLKELFIRKVRTGVSDGLVDLIDQATNN